MTARETIICDDLGAAIKRYESDGFLLDMIMPADDPREALISKNGESLSLVASRKSKVQSPRSERITDFRPETLGIGPVSEAKWITGRAGMMYRDLIPARLNGKVIVSHIHIIDGGEVADRVHYHKIGLQIIYCLKGAICVVYEDQGSPFWLKPGDCVLQPPEIRHRVLEADAGSEVIEVTSPAEHETWFDHELMLPTNDFDSHRIFRTQQFARHIDADSVWKPHSTDGIMVSDTNIPGVRSLKDASGRFIVNLDRTGTTVLALMIDGKGVEVTLPE